MQQLALALTATNLVILCLTLTQSGPATAQAVAPTLRGRALELVDDRGRVRSRLDVAPDGEVVLRLLDKNGIIRVTTNPGVHLIARRAGTAERPTTTSVTLTGADGRPRVIRP